MKTADRVVLIYGASVFGAAFVSYLRGREWADIGFDAAVHGAVAGTGLNVIGWLVIGSEEEAVANPEFEGMGNVAPAGVKLLEQVDGDVLYRPMKTNGVKVAPIPSNPNIVLQDPD